MQSKIRSVCVKMYVVLVRLAIKSPTHELYMKYFMD
jgi:hypothetical protein